MLKNILKFVSVFFFAITLAALICSCGGDGGKDSNKPNEPAKTVVKIGLIGPLTGDIAAMGQGMKNGATLAVEQANEREDVKAKNIVFRLRENVI